MNDLERQFEQWWDNEGRFFEGNHRAFAELAFKAAMGISRDYTADDAEAPYEITFANGRKVRISESPVIGERFGFAHLEIE